MCAPYHAVVREREHSCGLLVPGPTRTINDTERQGVHVLRNLSWPLTWQSSGVAEDALLLLLLQCAHRWPVLNGCRGREQTAARALPKPCAVSPSGRTHLVVHALMPFISLFVWVCAPSVYV